MTITDADRPDPLAGREASLSYAERWARSHEEGDDLAYRLGYIDLLTLDGMLSDYRLLDVGCGTGGFLKLAKNATEIVGIDFSQAMIAKAREFGLERASFQCCRFENFTPDRPFDAIRMSGVFGWYQPWPGNEGQLTRARGMLRRGGILIASYVPPVSPIHAAKAAIFPRKTVLMRERKFLAMTRAAGFEHLFSIASGQSRYAFLRPTP